MENKLSVSECGQENLNQHSEKLKTGKLGDDCKNSKLWL